MPVNVVIPSLGESITQGVVSSWLKPDGSYVKRDEEVLELETDKITMPIPATASGVLRHKVGQGDTVAVGAVIAEIDESASPPAASPPAPAARQQAESKPAAPAPAASQADRSVSAPADVRATPLARKLAEENKIDLASVAPTGPGGRVREQDVRDSLSGAKRSGGAPPDGRQAASFSPASPRSAPARAPGSEVPGERITRERMTPLRQRIAVRLVEAQHTAAMLTTFNECDMTAVMDLRTRHKDAFEKSHGVKLGFMSFFVKACAAALAKVPAVNASIVQGEGGPEIEYHHYADIAVAVGTEKGLVVPVLRGCESLSFAGVEKGINQLALKARDGKLTLEDLQGGTFTISNGGVYGSMMSTPILNPPQSGILGMHNIIRRPVENPAKPGSGEVVVRPMMYLALSYDHRVVDGQGAVTFLRAVKDAIENPERLLLEL